MVGMKSNRTCSMKGSSAMGKSGGVSPGVLLCSSELSGGATMSSNGGFLNRVEVCAQADEEIHRMMKNKVDLRTEFTFSADLRDKALWYVSTPAGCKVTSVI